MKQDRPALRCLLLAALVLLLFAVNSVPSLMPRLIMGLPILVIPAVSIAALYEKETVGALLGLLAGAMLDCFTPTGGIYSTVVLFVCGGVAGFLGRFIFAENFLSAVTLTAGVTFVYLAGKWLIFSVILADFADWQLLKDYSLTSFVYTMASVLLLFPVVRGIHRAFYAPPRRSE